MSSSTITGRLELDASRLWREHPPQIHDAKKAKILALAGGRERVPLGTLVVTRWAPCELPRVGARSTRTSVVSAEGPFSYARADAVDVWHLNFADTHLFAFYGGPLFAQDEIQVAEHPILGSLREALASGAGGVPPLTHDGERPTPILVRNVERWCAIDTRGIYGNRLMSASDAALEHAVTRLVDAPPSNIIAMVAPQGAGRYTRDQIREVVVTAATAFDAARSESTQRLRIHTGHWGTGAFGGNRLLMAAAQVVAARIAGVDDLVYHSLDPVAAEAFEQGRAIAAAIDDGATVDDVVEALHARGFVWGQSDGN